MVTVSAADPLNLVGIIVPGLRIPSKMNVRIAYLDGEPIAARFGDHLLPPDELGMPGNVRVPIRLAADSMINSLLEERASATPMAAAP